MAVLYLDICTGISGDMFLASLMDLGFSLDQLAADLSSLPLPPFQLQGGAVKKGGLLGKTFQVFPQQEEKEERSLSAILQLIGESSLPKEVKRTGAAVFTRLGEAEARVHGTSVEEVHFHEVGALDSIIDVLGVSLGLYHLQVDTLFSSPVPLGRGFTSSRHGPIPVPAPAAAVLLQGIPCYGTGIEAELVTPTGAALLSTLVTHYGSMPAMRIEGVGIGAGMRDLPLPNLLRVFLGRRDESKTEQVLILTTSMDDLSPEVFPYLRERLFAGGAVDVFITPLLMKKGRPGFQVQVLLPREKREEIARILFTESSTLGLRIREEERLCLERREVMVEVLGMKVTVKLGLYQGEVVNVSPEYADCYQVAEAQDMSLQQVYQLATTAYYQKQEGEMDGEGLSPAHGESRGTEEGAEEDRL